MFAEVLLDKLKNSKIIIYGIGGNGLYAYRYLQSYGIDIIGFADRKADEGIASFQNKPCKQLGEYKDNQDVCVIVTPLKDNINILKNINEKGFDTCISWYEMEVLFRLNPLKEWNDICKTYLKENENYRGIYAGKRCFVIGTGPSINNQDLSVLKNEFVFTVNTGYKLLQFEEINTNFHVFVDSMYFSESISKTDRDSFAEILLKKLTKDTICFFPYSKAQKFIAEYSLDKKLFIKYLEEDLRQHWDENDIDFTKLTPLTGTVVLTAVFLAIYMGFKEINLLGCDCTDILTSIGSKTKNANMVSYAWTNDPKQQERLENTLGNRSFESIYRIQFLKFRNFRYINDICKASGIKLFNCTDGGLLDCIERRDFMSIVF